MGTRAPLALPAPRVDLLVATPFAFVVVPSVAVVVGHSVLCFGTRGKDARMARETQYESGGCQMMEKADRLEKETCENSHIVCQPCFVISVFVDLID